MNGYEHETPDSSAVLTDTSDTSVIKEPKAESIDYDTSSLLIENDERFFKECLSNSITLTTGTGKTLTLEMSGDEIDVTGDADVSEAAKVFFECVKGYLREGISHD